MLDQKYITGRTAVNVARSVEDAIMRRTIGADEQLPPVRELAAHLGVSPATIGAAYRLLRERGLALSDGRRGTRVRPTPPLAFPPPAPLPTGVRDVVGGNPDPHLLPDLAAALRRLRIEQRLYGEELSDEHLVALARRHFTADGIDAKHLTVVSGALDGLERVLREHLRAGDRVAVEDPSFTGVLDLLSALSLVAVPVAIDDEGFRPDALRAVVKSVQALIVTPRAQNPTGAAMSARRARQLRTIVDTRRELLVLEDDHAGPIAGAPYVSLVSATRPQWAVVRSVSKSLGPDLRVAVLAADAQTIARVEGRQRLGIRWVSWVLQTLVATLWSDRRVTALLRRAAKTYAERRHALIDALQRRGIEAHGVSGLNVWIPVAEESSVMQALLQKGWAVAAGARYRIATGPAIRVTISALTPHEAERFAADLAAVLEPVRRASGA